MENKWKLGVGVPKIRDAITLYPRFVQVRYIMLGHASLQDGFFRV